MNNARVFDGEVYRHGHLSVGVSRDKIVSVGASPVRATKIIDAGGKFLMPSLIDSELHLVNMGTATDEATMAADVKEELPDCHRSHHRQKRSCDRFAAQKSSVLRYG